MQGLIAISGKNKLILRPNNTSKRAVELREGLELKGEAKDASVFVAKCSFYELAKEIGYSTNSGSVLKNIKACIKRLYAMSIVVHYQNKWAGFKLLSSIEVDDKNNQLRVALNPRVTEAIFGSKPHTRIELDEVRKLKSDPARILHQRLCAIVSPGMSRKILADTLMSYIWPNTVEGSAKRRRLMTLRKALAEIAATGAWDIKEDYQITRKGEFKRKLSSKKKKTT